MINEETSELAMYDEDEARVQVMQPTAVGAIAKSEVEAQLDAAHKYGRSVKRFMQEALTLATVTKEVAESCIYSLPRDGKAITGPSVRLAEICASSYGNLHVGARVIDITDKEVVAQGVAWDLERNLRVSVETRRRITSKNGRRFNDDMITMTGNAAASIALRNALFRVIPRAYVDTVYAKVKLVAVGSATTLAARRDEVVKRLALMGATPERVFNAIGVKGIEDVTLEHLEALIGFGTAIKAEEKTVDECFPPILAPVPGEQQEGRRVSLGKKPGKKEEVAEPPKEDKPAADGTPEPGSEG